MRLSRFGRGLDALKCFPDAPTDLAPARDEQFGRSIPCGAPQELECLREKGSGLRLPHHVPPVSLLSLGAVVDRGEREFATGIRCGDDCGALPFQRAKPVVSAEARPGRRRRCSVDPLTAVALGTPLAHAADVGDEPVHDFWWGGDVDDAAAALGCRRACQSPLLVPDDGTATPPIASPRGSIER